MLTDQNVYFFQVGAEEPKGPEPPVFRDPGDGAVKMWRLHNPAYKSFSHFLWGGGSISKKPLKIVDSACYTLV